MNIESKMIWLTFDDNTDDLIYFNSKNIERKKSRIIQIKIIYTSANVNI